MNKCFLLGVEYTQDMQYDSRNRMVSLLNEDGFREVDCSGTRAVFSIEDSLPNFTELFKSEKAIADDEKIDTLFEHFKTCVKKNALLSEYNIVMCEKRVDPGLGIWLSDEEEKIYHEKQTSGEDYFLKFEEEEIPKIEDVKDIKSEPGDVLLIVNNCDTVGAYLFLVRGITDETIKCLENLEDNLEEHEVYTVIRRTILKHKGVRINETGPVRRCVCIEYNGCGSF